MLNYAGVAQSRRGVFEIDVFHTNIRACIVLNFINHSVVAISW